MNPFTFIHVALTPGFSLLPPEMDTPAARAMVVAIALQESDLEHRRQLGGGPARGFLGFEPVGCLGVLTHPRTRIEAAAVCRELAVPAQAPVICAAMEWADALAVAFARLYLWSSPLPLPPDEHSYEIGWALYRHTWRPGKPRPERWAANFGVGHDLLHA